MLIGFAFNSNTYNDYINVLPTANCSVGLTTIGEQNTIQYSPNPTQDNILISLEKAISGTIEVITLQGATIATNEITAVQELTISLKDYPAGIYFVNIQTAKAKHILKVIKID